MEEAEKLALSTSLPELINQVVVNTRLKANIISSGILDEDVTDDLIEKNNGQNLVFKLVQRVKRGAEAGSFSKLEEVLRGTGQGGAADVLHTHLLTHSRLPVEPALTRGITNHTALAASEICQSMPHSRDNEELPAEPCSELPNRRWSPKDVSDFREKLRRRLPPCEAEKQLGDVVVPSEYYNIVYRFIASSTAAVPGPLPDIDTSKLAHNKGSFCYLPPESCAFLSQMLGGKPKLFYTKHRGHEVFKSAATFDVVYCKAEVYADPGRILIQPGAWISTQFPLREVLSTFTAWPDFEARGNNCKDVLDLSSTAKEWYYWSSTMGIRILRKGKAANRLTKQDKQEMMRCYMEALEDGDARGITTKTYAERVLQFIHGQMSGEPGPLEGAKDTLSAHYSDNVSGLPVDLCATLIELYGGGVSMVEGRRQGCSALLSMSGCTKYVSVRLFLRPDDSPLDRSLGSFFLAFERTLSVGISGALGWFPSRAQAVGIIGDLDLSMTVQQWFEKAEKINITVWMEPSSN